MKISDNIRPQNGVKTTITKADKLKQTKLLEKRQKIMEQIKLMLTSSDKSHIKAFIKLPENGVKLKKVPARLLNEKEKELLYTRIMKLNELDLHQKFELFTYLRICCRTDAETRSKLVEMLDKKRRNRNELQNQIDVLISNLNDKTKFTCKRKIFSYTIKRRKWMKTVKIKASPFSTILKDGKFEQLKPQFKKSLENGMNVEDKNENDVIMESDTIPTKALTQINHVVFGTGAHGHLVIVCTDSRLLVWNLLSLRLQTAVKLSVHQISIDPYTNLIAAFTKYNECEYFLIIHFIFLANTFVKQILYIGYIDYVIMYSTSS